MPSVLASSEIEAYSPLSIIRRQRWARASALSRDRSILGCGGAGTASESMVLRPPRIVNVIGTCTVIVVWSVASKAFTPHSLLKRVSSSKPKPLYPLWSEFCAHEHGKPLSETFIKWQGGVDSALEMRRRAIVSAEPYLSVAERKRALSQYGAALREKKNGFAELIVKDYYYTTGIRWPLAEHPVRENIPLELWIDLKYFPEQNKARGWSGLEERYVTYVE